MDRNPDLPNVGATCFGYVFGGLCAGCYHASWRRTRPLGRKEFQCQSSLAADVPDLWRTETLPMFVRTGHRFETSSCCGWGSPTAAESRRSGEKGTSMIACWCRDPECALRQSVGNVSHFRSRSGAGGAIDRLAIESTSVISVLLSLRRWE